MVLEGVMEQNDAVTNVVNYICNGLDQGFRGVVGIFLLIQKLQFYGIILILIFLKSSWVTEINM